MDDYNTLIPDILFRDNTKYSIHELKKYIEEYNQVSTLLDEIEFKIKILTKRPLVYDLKKTTSDLLLINLGITEINLFKDKTTLEKITKILEIIGIIENISLLNYLIKILLCLLNEECLLFKKNKENDSLKYYKWIRRIDTVKIKYLPSYKNTNIKDYYDMTQLNNKKLISSIMEYSKELQKEIFNYYEYADKFFIEKYSNNNIEILISPIQYINNYEMKSMLDKIINLDYIFTTFFYKELKEDLGYMGNYILTLNPPKKNITSITYNLNKNNLNKRSNISRKKKTWH